MAAERGLDLGGVSGTGPEGRIVARDLAQARRAAAAAGAAPPAPRCPAARRAAGPAYTDVPLTQIRKTIAKRLAQSIGPIPTFYLTTEVDMERVWEAREALLKAAAGATSGQGLVQRHHHQGGGASRSGSTRPATPGGRTTTSATGTRCTSAWRSRSRTG